ncbi:MAG: hypothetical protein K1060chlam5_00187 [Candidatus Anoxychlamydiales bacterium]|nr:hypothetical protein [Candidatus Anoxychlamydiales bacterium]
MTALSPPSSRSTSPWEDITGTGIEGLEVLKNNLKFKKILQEKHLTNTVAIAQLNYLGIQITLYMIRDRASSNNFYKFKVSMKKEDTISDDELENAKDILKLYFGNICPNTQLIEIEDNIDPKTDKKLTKYSSKEDFSLEDLKITYRLR